MADGNGTPPIVIKKYANRRLYNTQTSSYVTLDHLNDLVREGVEFVVQDAKSNDDITRQVLAQIIMEQEGKGQNMLPVEFLRQLIRIYGDNMQSFVPSYLNMSMEQFTRSREQMREALERTVGSGMSNALSGGKPYPQFFEEQIRQNMAMFEQAMKMFSPFGTMPKSEKTETPAAAPAPAASEPDIGELKRQMELMQRQLNALSKKTGKD